MRTVIAAASLLITVFSIGVDLSNPPPDSALCVHNGCRYEQMFAGIDAAGDTPDSVAALVNADAANPLVWCTYAETLAHRGEVEKARSAFDHAVSLGPSMPPVLMRAANFDFVYDRREHGFDLAARILDKTPVYDETVFSHLQNAGVPVGALIGTAIPARPRPARSWLGWLHQNGSAEDISTTWLWMQRQILLDDESAGAAAWALWNRGSYALAHSLWSGWLGTTALLGNTHFEHAPKPSPFDWTLIPVPAVRITQSGGLDLRFLGTENVAFAGVRQYTLLPAGRYRLAAEVSSDNITTDQGPFFHIFDPTNRTGLNVESGEVHGTVPRTWIKVTFIVPPGAGAVAVWLERRPSELFDNRIQGTLHIHQISLTPETSFTATRRRTGSDGFEFRSTF